MKLEKLRQLMSDAGIDYYVIPTDDFHASEYVGDYFQAREYVSGFTGSAGTLLVGKDFAGLWTDGRYFLQASQQLLGSGIELMKMGVAGVPSLTEYLAANDTKDTVYGFDGRCVSADFVEELKTALNRTDLNIVYDKDLVGEMWEDRPALSRKPAWLLEDESCGASAKEKIAMVREEMKKKGAESLLLTSLDDIAWLFNMRGDDIAFNPVVLAFCVITEKEVRLFIQKGSLNAEQEIQFAMNGILIAARKCARHHVELHRGVHHCIHMGNDAVLFHHILQRHLRDTAFSAADDGFPPQVFPRERFISTTHQKCAITIGHLCKYQGCVLSAFQMDIDARLRTGKTDLDFSCEDRGHDLVGTTAVDQFNLQSFFCKKALTHGHILRCIEHRMGHFADFDCRSRAVL